MQITRSEKIVLTEHLNPMLLSGADLNKVAIDYSTIPVRQEEVSCILILLLKLEFLKNYKGCRGAHEDDLSAPEKVYFAGKYERILNEWYKMYPEYNLNMSLDVYIGLDSRLVTKHRNNENKNISIRIDTPIDENVPTYLVYRHIELRDLIVSHLGYCIFDSIVGETFYKYTIDNTIKMYMLIHTSLIDKFKRLYVLKSKDNEVVSVLSNNHCLDVNNEWYASKTTLIKELGDSISKTIESLQDDLKELKGCVDEFKTEISN